MAGQENQTKDMAEENYRLESEVSALQSELDGEKKKREAASKQLKDCRKKFREDLEQSEEKIAELNKEKDTLSEQLKAAKQTCKSLEPFKDELIQVRHELVTEKKQNESLKADLETSKKKLAEADKSNKELKERIFDIEDKLKVKEKECASLTKALDQANAQKVNEPPVLPSCDDLDVQSLDQEMPPDFMADEEEHGNGHEGVGLEREVDEESAPTIGEELLDLRQHDAALQERFDKVELELKQSQEQNDKLKAEIASLLSRLSKYEQDRVTHQEDAQAGYDELEEEGKTREEEGKKRTETTRSEVPSITLEKLEETVEARHKEERERAKQEFDALAKRCDQLEQEYQRRLRDNTESASLKARCDELETQIKQQYEKEGATTISEINKEINSLQKWCDRLEERMNSQNKESSKTTEARQSLVKDPNELERVWRDYDEQIASLRARLEGFQTFLCKYLLAKASESVSLTVLALMSPFILLACLLLRFFLADQSPFLPPT